MRKKFYNHIHTLRNEMIYDTEMKSTKYTSPQHIDFAYYYSLKDIQDMDSEISKNANIIESEDYTAHEKSKARAILGKLSKTYSNAQL